MTRLRWRRFSLWRMRFMADLVFAKLCAFLMCRRGGRAGRRHPTVGH
jgi:hypothetical protein